MAIKHGKTIQFNYKTLRISQKPVSNVNVSNGHLEKAVPNFTKIFNYFFLNIFYKIYKNVKKKIKTDYNLSSEYELNIDPNWTAKNTLKSFYLPILFDVGVKPNIGIQYVVDK